MRRGAVALAVAVAAAALSACSGGSYKVTATFDDVGDLVKDHSVQVADVRVGRISRIELTDDFKAEVTLSIGGGRRIPRDSVAVLRTTSLLGEKFVELRPRDPEHPDRGPFLRDGDRIKDTLQAPELEFVAEEAVNVLGAITSTDIATLVDTGAAGFGGRGDDLRSLLDDLSQLSNTLAERSGTITSIIDSLDRATATLASGRDEVSGLLGNLAETTRLLSENRDRTVTALDELSRLASVQNDILLRYRSDIDRQLEQVDTILGIAASQTGEVASLVDWLDRFVVSLPKAIPDEFTQVYMWLVPQEEDPRTHG